MPEVRRGEIPVKLTINVPPEAFSAPTLSQEITVDDWRQGIEFNDVEFRQSIITPAEAEQIRQSRLTKMRAILEEQGFTVTKPEDRS